MVMIIDDLRRRVIVRAVGFLSSVPQPPTPWTDADIDLALRNAFVAEMFEIWEAQAANDSNTQRLAHLQQARKKYASTYIAVSHDMGFWIDEMDALWWALMSTSPSPSPAARWD